MTRATDRGPSRPIATYGSDAMLRIELAQGGIAVVANATKHSFGLTHGRHMDIKGFLMDQFGHFGLPQVGSLIFALLIAALLGWALGALAARKPSAVARDLALWAATAALAVGLVRSQLPLALALVALALVASIGRAKGRAGLLRAGALVLGLGCGSGAALVTFIVAVPYFFLVRWNASSKASS